MNVLTAVTRWWRTGTAWARETISASVVAITSMERTTSSILERLINLNRDSIDYMSIILVDYDGTGEIVKYPEPMLSIRHKPVTIDNETTSWLFMPVPEGLEEMRKRGFKMP